MLSFLRKFNDTKEKVLVKYLRSETEKFLQTDIGKSYLFYDSICLNKNKNCNVEVTIIDNGSFKTIKTINTLSCKEITDVIEINIGIEKEYFNTYDLGSISALVMISWLNQVIIKYTTNKDTDFIKAFNMLVKRYPELIVYYKAGLLQSKIPNSITSTYFPPNTSMGDIVNKIL